MNSLRTDPPLRNDDLPCLVIYTDPSDRRAILRTIPDWSAADLVEFLGSAIDTVLEHLDDPADTRLDAIAAELTRPGAVVQSRLGHLFGKAVDYATAHPAKIVVGAVNGALLLSGMGWLPLSSPRSRR